MPFTIFGFWRTHHKKSKKPQTYYNRFLICSKVVVICSKGLDSGPGPLDQASFSAKVCRWLYILAGQVLWPNNLQFKRYIEKCTLVC